MTLVIFDTFDGTAGTSAGHVPNTAPPGVVVESEFGDYFLLSGDGKLVQPVGYSASMRYRPQIVGPKQPGVFDVTWDVFFGSQPSIPQVLTLSSSLDYNYEVMFADYLRLTVEPDATVVEVDLFAFSQGSGGTPPAPVILALTAPFVVRMVHDFTTATSDVYVNDDIVFHEVGEQINPVEYEEGGYLGPGAYLGPWSFVPSFVAIYSTTPPPDTTPGLTKFSFDYTPGVPGPALDFWTSEILCQEF